MSRPIRFPFRAVLAAAAFLAALPLAACGAGGKGDAAKKDKRPPTVGFVVLQPSSVPVTTELSGRVTAFQSSEVRPQVSGIIRRRLFTEGTLVHQGQTLYEIDPRLYRAAVGQAQANLTSAQANADATQVRAERYRPLAQAQAISQQDFTDAAAQSRQATASVAQNRAALETARINLGFTRVPAPISGRIGRSLFTEGALVTASQADPLTTIQRLDPIFVDIQQSSADLLALRRALAAGGVTPTRALVRLKLEDGSDYGETGSIEFSEVVVDASTGSVTLRARFRNRAGLLFPGMFVRTSFAQAIDHNAFLVPQVAVARDAKGTARVFVVGPGDKAQQRDIAAERTLGANWVVTRGLKPGDRVIVQGLANLKPGAPVRPVAANAPERIVTPKGKDAGGGGAAASRGG